MSVLNRSHLESGNVGTKMVQTYKIAVLGDGGVGKSGEKVVKYLVADIHCL